MEPRLATQMIVSALRKRAECAGGTCTLVAHGDDIAGGLILICAEKGQSLALLELAYDLDGAMGWRQCLPQTPVEEQKSEDYLAERRRTDPDLWVIELDIPAAERFAADFVTKG